ncbi:MAG: phytanoyl-CoA dioxygenase family protein [Rhodospirillales bacterium]|nr:phytanoyl-CoA dioxygenase family protein [Rhodospirillales bacterium]
MNEHMIGQPVVDQFQEDGAVLLKGVFADWVETLQAGLDRNLREPSPTARYHKGDGETPFFNDYCNWDRIPEYRSFIYDSPAAAAVARLTGSKGVRFFHEHVVLKEVGNAVATPWHHDQPYYCVNGAMTCSLWVALDHVKRDVAVEYVAGSHTWGKMFTPLFFSGKVVSESPDWEELPDIDNHRDDYRILGWPTEPGDAIAFNFRTIHGAPANTSSTRRAAIAFRWLGDDVTYADRGGETSPPFPDLKLKEGDEMDAPEFPLVWQS